jgi:hypothetical protein
VKGGYKSESKLMSGIISGSIIAIAYGFLPFGPILVPSYVGLIRPNSKP